MKRNHTLCLNGVNYQLVYDTNEKEYTEAHVLGLNPAHKNKKYIRILHQIENVPVLTIMENAFAKTDIEAVLLPAINLLS